MPPKIRRCAVKGCGAISKPGDGKTMHRFPLEAVRQGKWKAACYNPTLSKLTPKQVHERHVMCPCHFETKMYFDGDHRSFLGSWAYPSLNCHEDLADEPGGMGEGRSGDAIASQPASEDVTTPQPQPASEGQNPSWFEMPGMPLYAVTPVSPPIHPPLTDADAAVLSPSGKRMREEDDFLDLDLHHIKPPTKVLVCEITKEPARRRSPHSSGARDRSPSPKRTRVSKTQLAENCGVQLTLENEPVVKGMQEYRQIALKVKRKLKTIQKSNGSLAVLAKRKFIDMVDELTVSSRLRKMLRAELINFKRKACGRTWSLDDRLFALALYKRSPRSYRFLRQHILLPCESTLKALLSSIPIEPGISKPLLSLLKRSGRKMTARDRNCVLLFDEMILTGRLNVNKSKQIVSGLENYGNRGRTDLVADHALVFMVQGVNTKWTQPIAFYFVHQTCPSDMLKLLITDVVRAVFEVGFNVLATVSDQGPTNRGAVSLLKSSSSLNDDIIYSIDGHNLVHIYDVPHLFKSSRNNLLSSDLEYKVGCVAQWRHIIEFFKLDSSLGNNSQLTMKHVNPLGKQKMRVKYAAQVISASVASLIESYIRLSSGTYLNNCMVTVNLLKDIDLFLDLTNGPTSSDKKKKSQRVNVSASSLHHEEWPNMVEKLHRWRFIRKSSEDIHVPPFVQGWIQTVKGFQYIWSQVSSLQLKVLQLRNFNQDALENLFCCIRQCSGGSTDLTCTQFIGALKTCMVTKFSGVKDKNCIDDDSYLLNDLHSLLTTSGDVANNSQQTNSLIRGARPLPPGEVHTISRISSSFILSFLDDIQSQCRKCQECLSRNRLNPSHELNELVVRCQGAFNRSWRDVLHKPNVFPLVENLCTITDSDWSWFDCDADSMPMRRQVQQKLSSFLIEQRVRKTNQALKSKKFKRTRQVEAGSVKDVNGLLGEEETNELTINDLQFLEGSLDRVPPQPAEINTPTPQRRTPLRTPQRTPQRTPAQKTPQATPGIFSMNSITPVAGPSGVGHSNTSARQKVFANWSGTLCPPPPAAAAPASILSVTPKQVTPKGLDEGEVLQLCQQNMLEKMTCDQLKKFLKGKCKITKLKKEELINGVYSYFSNV